MEQVRIEETVEVFRIPHIDDYWDVLKPLVQKAIENRRFVETETLESLYLDLKSGKRQLWFGSDEIGKAIAVTTLHQYPKVKVIELNYIGGENIQGFYLQAYEMFKDYGRENGCTILRGFGRVGWLKLLPDKVTEVIQWDVKLC